MKEERWTLGVLKISPEIYPGELFESLRYLGTEIHSGSRGCRETKSPVEVEVRGKESRIPFVPHFRPTGFLHSSPGQSGDSVEMTLPFGVKAQSLPPGFIR